MSRLLPHRRVVALLLVASVGCAPLLALAQHHKREAREEIAAVEAQWRKAQLANDVSAMDKLLSDDYLGITAAGEVVTKAQQLDRMRSQELTLSRLDISDVKIKLIGHSVAVVNSMATIAGTSDQHPLSGSFRYTRVYQRLPNGIWKITSFEPTRISPRGAQGRAAMSGNGGPATVSSPQ